MSLPYDQLAALYDDLMGEVDYDQWAGYLQQLIVKHGAPGRRLLDLGCGTGALTLRLAAAGYDVIGVDLSPEMLAIAVNKGLEMGLGPARWRCQDMRQLRCPGDSFDLVISACDGFNYLRSPAELLQTLRGIAACLMPGGLLLFDLHSEYKMREVFQAGQFVQESPAGFCFWTSQFEEQSGDCLHQLTIFSKQQGDLYLRSDESHRQHYFAPAEVTTLLEQTGFTLLGVFGFGGEQPPTTGAERLQWVARRGR